ncbi:sensor histidine kinase [Runella aurantiaca]|nr:7TM-DISM domain-containing protein [Runella aurantiaca]
MKRLFFCFCCLLAVLESIPFQSLGQQLLKEYGVSYLREPSRKLTIKDVQHSNQFRPLKSTFFSFGKDTSNHWLRFEVENRGLFSKEIIVEIVQPYLDSTVFYIADNQGNILKKVAEGWKTQYKNRSYPHRNFVAKSIVPPAQRLVYYVRIYKKYMHVTGEIKAWEGNTFVQKENTESGLMGLFMGFLLTNFIISVLLLTISKDRLYAYYALYILFSGLSTLMITGYFFTYYQQGFWGITGTEAKTLPLLFGQLSLLFFIKNYVLPNYRLTGFIKYIWYLALSLQGILLILINLLFLVERHSWPIPNALLLFITFSFFLPVLTGFYLILLSLVHKIEPQAAKTYLLGIFPMLLYSIFSYLRNLDFFPNHWLLGNEVRNLCFGFDILVLMIGLGYRYKALRDEKDKQKRLAYENQLKLWQEKERISRDLHDNVGSQLTIVSSGLDNALYLAEQNQLSSNNLESINQNVREAVQSLRDTIWVTHQENLRVVDLKIRIQHYLQKAFLDTTATKVYFNCTAEATELSSAQALNTFRIIQEAVQNIQKYACATIINVEINQKGRILYVKIEDNGIGFSLKDIDFTEHYGLQNMQKRAQELKGQLSLQAGSIQGTVVSLMLPLDNPN